MLPWSAWVSLVYQSSSSFRKWDTPSQRNFFQQNFRRISQPAVKPLPSEERLLLLAVLRGGGSDAAIVKSVEMKNWVRQLLPHLKNAPDTDLPGQLRRLILNACKEQLIEDRYVNQEVIELIVGTRADALNRRWISGPNLLKVLQTHYDVGSRRVNMIVKAEILPALAKAIDAYLGASTIATTDWIDCAVTLTARLHPSITDVYLLRVEQRFKCPARVIVIAMTDDETIANVLCGRFPVITDVSVPSRGMTSTPHLQYFDSSKGRQPVDVPLVTMTSTEVQALLGPGALEYDAVEYRQFRIPPSQGEMEYRLVQDHEMSVRTHCFWSAPRADSAKQSRN